MKPEHVISAQRGRFDGARQILRYNWPQYVAGLVLALLGLGWWWCDCPGPEWLRMLGLVTALTAVWWSVASVVASFWIYDVSPLYRWDWIPGALNFVPRRWLNLHAGLDESSPVLRRLFPDSEGKTGDFFDAAEMSEPSIQRARAGCERDAAERVSFRELPYPDHFFDSVFLLFAAHEVRHASSRELFFRELCRVLSPTGIILLVEHVRDVANFAAFGPGFFHFLPAGEWRRLANVTGLQVAGECRMTPFVKIVLLRRKP